MKIGAIVIGRNEGQRLIRCLQSLVDTNSIVYVDSGSTDSSVNSAKALGIEVVELDTTIPFTAARARNTGVYYLLQKYPDIEFIQFVDGDCEIADGWIEISSQFLRENPDYAVVCGRRRERFPQASIYNQLCDIEWDTPIGDTLACGGDALIRVSAFMHVNGYRDSMIAGEEPEMCYRLRGAGWKISRIDTEMTKHDAEMTRISQWWKRSKRAGHAYAESLYIHHSDVEKFRKRELVSILLWGLMLPVFILVLSISLSGYWLIFSVVYPLQVLRLYLAYRDGLSDKNALLYACSNVLGKFAQLAGVISFVLKKVFGKDSVLIEYK
ncbi:MULTISPECIES: glycosyltransferase [unclassified Methylophaga]|jgi:glycosyltransferase involved in cell wall biosynthesis|uniref:glycosyltransferase n=1 Tax=unclassified Methylophaga TaxID=2629249 RepID=UPI000C5AE78C|nr:MULTISPECIES: glycosyltransferase [unclassified Methylophaga]MAL48882.1 glycosyl transferase [Methylophaga sp.]MAM27578.1 glycosyl transferase [Flavobacteriaceae bacterium]MBP40709.1 glycosyl transferase [Aequorivita sp.]HCC82428.1 glycosyl transferase [Methylophaga sp.]|tara:strand:- start:9855 stop:10829 length:975 start_codon:yes stop_codon:yes gene_type:complete